MGLYTWIVLKMGKKRRPYGVWHALLFIGKMRHMHINTDTVWMMRLYGFVCVYVYMQETAVDSLPRQTHTQHTYTWAHNRSISNPCESTDTYLCRRLCYSHHCTTTSCLRARARVCMCTMLCTQNHRFVWTTNINDASVYLDLSLLTNEVNFLSYGVSYFVSFSTRYYNRREYCVRPNATNRPRNVDWNRKKSQKKLSHRPTTTTTNKTKPKPKQNRNWGEKNTNGHITIIELSNLRWIIVDTLRDLGIPPEINLRFLLFFIRRYSPFGGLARDTTSVDSRYKPRHRAIEVSAFRDIQVV